MDELRCTFSGDLLSVCHGSSRADSLPAITWVSGRIRCHEMSWHRGVMSCHRGVMKQTTVRYFNTSNTSVVRTEFDGRCDRYNVYTHLNCTLSFNVLPGGLKGSSEKDEFCECLRNELLPFAV